MDPWDLIKATASSVEYEGEDPSPYEAAELAALKERAAIGKAASQTLRATELSSQGESPRALKLAQPGLHVPSAQARKVYTALGEKLYKGQGLRKQERRDYVAARRILEKAWGISLLREGASEPVSDFFTGKMPSRTRDIDATQATVVFGKRTEGFGRGRKTKEQVQAILYGVAAQEKADALVLARLKKELQSAKKTLLKHGPDTHLGEGALRQRDAVEGKLKEMQQRRQRQADLLEKALEELGLSKLR